MNFVKNQGGKRTFLSRNGIISLFGVNSATKETIFIPFMIFNAKSLRSKDRIRFSPNTPPGSISLSFYHLLKGHFSSAGEG